MKKVGIIVLVLVLLLGLGTMAAYAKANKVDLPDEYGNPVGWVIFNKNASGDIIAQVHLNNGEEGTYMAQLSFKYENGAVLKSADDGELTVNTQGKGNCHLKGDSTDVVEVRVRVREDTNGSTVYRTDWHAI